MRLSRLTKREKIGIIERWYQHHYRESKFTGAELIPIIRQDAESTLRTRKSPTTGFSLAERLTQQIEVERASDRYSLHSFYEKYKSKL